MSNLPRNFVLQLGSLVTLYVSIAAFLTLVFGTINVAIPDAADTVYSWDNNQSAMRLGMALLIVFFPVYLTLTRLVNEARRRSNDNYIGVTKWLIYLSLLVCGLVFMGDLVTIITTYLEGEMTLRFMLKAVSMLLVLGLAFYYYSLDAKGYWHNMSRYSIVYGAVTSVIVVGAMMASCYHIETPSEVRERKLDAAQVDDLTDIYWRIDNHYTQNGSLPMSIDELYETEVLPHAPTDRAEYQYKITGDTTFEFCAEFATESFDTVATRPVLTPETRNYNWNHDAGYVCFEREVVGKLVD